jgi:hypothetical protein
VQRRSAQRGGSSKRAVSRCTVGCSDPAKSASRRSSGYFRPRRSARCTLHATRCTAQPPCAHHHREPVPLLALPFHCLDFLCCLIPLRDPALKQALFVRCPSRPKLTNDAPPNYPYAPTLVYPPARLSSLQGSRGFPVSIPYIPWACFACFACFVDLAPWPDDYTAAQLGCTIRPV